MKWKEILDYIEQSDGAQAIIGIGFVALFLVPPTIILIGFSLQIVGAYCPIKC